MPTPWTHADAWVLASLAGTSADNCCALSEVVARADALNHAVLTEREFTTALARLAAAGLAVAGPDGYALTPAGAALYEDRAGKGGWAESLPVGLRGHGEPPAAEPLELPPGEFDKAVAAYQAAVERALS